MNLFFYIKKARKGGVEWMSWKITEFIKPLILNQLKHDDGIAYLFVLHNATVSKRYQLLAPSFKSKF